MSKTLGNSVASPWPHRWAIALACATFPLVWVGGLVTTTDSGMAVPDWPNTYGYNLFLYPWKSWITGPWSLFLEHGHRLIGATVGMLTIGLLIVLWRKDERRWMRWLGLAALVLVVFQGILGGMRVRFDERTLAMLHGCTGPLFFAVTSAMVVFTSRRWRDGPGKDAPLPSSVAPIRRLAAATCVLVYLQILIGAVLRHVPVAAEPGTFALAVRFHLFLAAIVTLHAAGLVWLLISRARRIKPLAGLAATLAVLVITQLALGAGTWIVKFSVPAWASSLISTGNAAIQDGGWLQTHVITAHVAVGSLLLITSLAIALYTQRLLPASTGVTTLAAQRLEAAV
jgi:cytochrome c oxidase assembly protein subunit 15